MKAVVAVITLLYFVSAQLPPDLEVAQQTRRGFVAQGAESFNPGRIRLDGFDVLQRRDVRAKRNAGFSTLNKNLGLANLSEDPKTVEKKNPFPALRKMFPSLVMLKKESDYRPFPLMMRATTTTTPAPDNTTTTTTASLEMLKNTSASEELLKNVFHKVASNLPKTSNSNHQGAQDPLSIFRTLDDLVKSDDSLDADSETDPRSRDVRPRSGTGEIHTLNPFDLDESSKFRTMNPLDLDGRDPFDLDESSKIHTLNPFDLDGSGKIHTLNPFDLDESTNIRTLNPFDLDGSGKIHTLNPFDLDESGKIHSLNPGSLGTTMELNVYEDPSSDSVDIELDIYTTGSRNLPTTQARPTMFDLDLLTKTATSLSSRKLEPILIDEELPEEDDFASTRSHLAETSNKLAGILELFTSRFPPEDDPLDLESTSVRTTLRDERILNKNLQHLADGLFPSRDDLEFLEDDAPELMTPGSESASGDEELLEEDDPKAVTMIPGNIFGEDDIATDDELEFDSQDSDFMETIPDLSEHSDRMEDSHLDASHDSHSSRSHDSHSSRSHDSDSSISQDSDSSISQDSDSSISQDSDSSISQDSDSSISQDSDSSISQDSDSSISQNSDSSISQDSDSSISQDSDSSISHESDSSISQDSRHAGSHDSHLAGSQDSDSSRSENSVPADLVHIQDSDSEDSSSLQTTPVTSSKDSNSSRHNASLPHFEIVFLEEKSSAGESAPVPDHNETLIGSVKLNVLTPPPNSHQEDLLVRKISPKFDQPKTVPFSKDAAVDFLYNYWAAITGGVVSVVAVAAICYVFYVWRRGPRIRENNKHSVFDWNNYNRDPKGSPSLHNAATSTCVGLNDTGIFESPECLVAASKLSSPPPAPPLPKY